MSILGWHGDRKEKLPAAYYTAHPEDRMDHDVPAEGNAPVVEAAETRGRHTKAVPLEETLELCGYGKFDLLLGTAVFLQRSSCLATVLIMSFVVPAIGCHFSLSPSHKGTLASMPFVGMVCSSYLHGFLSDRYGRRYTSVRCSAACSVLSVAACFAYNYTMLVIVWFAMGFFLAGVLTPVIVYLSEFTPAKQRSKIMFTMMAFSALATAYDPCVAWLILPSEVSWKLWPGMRLSPWRLLLLTNAVPFLLGTLALWALPESPKYLLTRGRDRDTVRALAQAFAANTGRPKQHFPVSQVCLDEGDTVAEDGSTVWEFLSSMWHQTRLLISPPLLLCTLVFCTIQIGVVGTYNTVMLWFPEMANQMSLYWTKHGEYGVTLCHVLGSRSTDGGEQTVWYNRTDSLLLQAVDSPFGYTVESDLNGTEAVCDAKVETTVFLSNIAVGLLQFTAFLLTDPIVSLLGKKIVMGCFLAIPGLCCLLVGNLADRVYLTIALLGCHAILISATLPIVLTVVVDLFPTNIRSMATSVGMVCGRIGAAVGGQIFGHYQRDHCTAAFNIMGVSLLCIACVSALLPAKKKPT